MGKSISDKMYRQLYKELKDCIWMEPQHFQNRLKAASSKGFPIDCQDQRGATLLMWSLYNKNTDAAYAVPAILLEQGADPNIANRNGRRALDIAITIVSPLNLVERIIVCGADVNAQDDYGQTAFDRAAQYFIFRDERGSEYGRNAVRLLLDAGADPYLCNNWLIGLYTARKQELKELCDAYRICRAETDAVNLQETEFDLGSFER